MLAESMHAPTPTAGWYAVARSHAVPRRGRRPLRVQLWQCEPVAIWRDAQGALHALRDACPHRHVPLSAGTLQDNELTCPYHGWRFNAAGDCVHIPSEAVQRPLRACVPTYPCQDSMGLVWLWVGPQAPTHPPYAHPQLLASGRTRVQLQRRVRAHVVDVVENFIDSAHTPFLHRGIIRGHAAAQARSVEVHSSRTSVTARHAPVEEKVALSAWGRPRGPLIHHDTVHAPSVVEVVYRFGSQMPPVFMALIACTPRAADACDIYLTLSLNVGRWGALLRPLLRLFASVVLFQDMRMLQRQHVNGASLQRRCDFFPRSDTFHRRVRRLMHGRGAQPENVTRVEQFTLKV